ncbi:MAG: OmpA family protein, partial [Cyclobacteriaceae bacterium]|nr:OmpA family protein [Cyclobacteriaceae bacterium]
PVNTLFDEVTPYIHVNNQALFFSSNGHPGFGRYDLFLSERQDSSWAQPKNLGYPVNNHLDQLSMIISSDGKTGYFAQEEANEKGDKVSKIARVRFESDTLLSDRSSYVTGTIRDISDQKPLKASISLYDLTNGARKYLTQSDPVTGVYFFVLTEGKEYGVYVSSEGYLFEDFKFEFAQNTVVAPDTLDVFLQPLRVGASLVLENIYFEKESYELSPKSISELEEIAAFLRANKMRVEISGHTDDTGGDDYNQRLSERRAEAVYLYLVRNGINPVYLQKIGYGSTRPRYLEEVQKPLNRRIEFEIIEVKQ